MIPSPSARSRMRCSVARPARTRSVRPAGGGLVSAAHSAEAGPLRAGDAVRPRPRLPPYPHGGRFSPPPAAPHAGRAAANRRTGGRRRQPIAPAGARRRLGHGPCLRRGRPAGGPVIVGPACLPGRGRPLPALVRPYARMEPDQPKAQTQEDAPSLALRAGNSVTCLVGPADRIAAWIGQARNAARRDHVTEIWPRLTAVLYSRPGAADDPAPGLREALDGRGGVTAPLLLETNIGPDGPIAVEDPRRGCLSLLFDHGVYFEFMPAEEAGKPEAARHGRGRGGTRRRVRDGFDFPRRRVGAAARGWPCASNAANRRCFGSSKCRNRRCSKSVVDGRKVRHAPGVSDAGAPSTNRRHSGSAARKVRPYPLVSTRGSRMTTIPVSVAVRISRPNPCFSLMTACGTW